MSLASDLPGNRKDSTDSLFKRVSVSVVLAVASTLKTGVLVGVFREARERSFSWKTDQS